MSILEKDIASFERMRSQLEADHPKAWVVFHDGCYINAYSDFQTAAADAMERFNTGPFLIRQIGAPATVSLSGGMIFTPSHAVVSGRV